MPLTFNVEDVSVEASLKKIADELHQINDTLSKLTTPLDLTSEDHIVLTATSNILAAQGRIPPGQKKQTGEKPNAS